MIKKRHLVTRTLAAVALSGTLIGSTAACATDPRRLPPAIGGGVNADIGTTSPTKIRNLLVVTRDSESGFVSGALTGGTTVDQLIAINGIVIDTTGEPSGIPIEFTGGPTEVAPNALSQIAVGSPFTGTGKMPAGLTMRLSLTFAQAGPLTVDAPIVDGNDAAYRDASPAPTGGGKAPTPNGGSASPNSDSDATQSHSPEPDSLESSPTETGATSDSSAEDSPR